MIRILQCVNDMHRAGLETMLMNYYRQLDKSQIQFDFLTHRPWRGDYDDEIESMGGKVYYAPRLYPWNIPSYNRWMKQFFAEHPEYTIVHSHIDTMSYLPLRAAKKAGVKYRIAHSHNTALDKDYKYLLKQYYRSKITGVANVYLACGREAGKFLFNDKKFTVVPNAIDASKFYYNPEVRAKKREELGLNDEFVIGHVGRLSYQKNHTFLIDIFEQIHKKDEKAVLLLAGEGEKEQEIKDKVERLGLSSNVRFLGNRSDVNELYQAMDVFLLPSLFEGIPVVGVEAQFAGLQCIFSVNTPDEVAFTDKVKFIELSQSAEKWAEEVINCKGAERKTDEEMLMKSEYNINSGENKLESIYHDLYEAKQ